VGGIAFLNKMPLPLDGISSEFTPIISTAISTLQAFSDFRRGRLLLATEAFTFRSYSALPFPNSDLSPLFLPRYDSRSVVSSRQVFSLFPPERQHALEPPPIFSANAILLHRVSRVAFRVARGALLPRVYPGSSAFEATYNSGRSVEPPLFPPPKAQPSFLVTVTRTTKFLGCLAFERRRRLPVRLAAGLLLLSGFCSMELPAFFG